MIAGSVNVRTVGERADLWTDTVRQAYDAIIVTMDGLVSMEAMPEQIAVLCEAFAAVKTPVQRVGR
jgi:hypothetical protein